MAVTKVREDLSSVLRTHMKESQPEAGVCTYNLSNGEGESGAQGLTGLPGIISDLQTSDRPWLKTRLLGPEA